MFSPTTSCRGDIHSFTIQILGGLAVGDPVYRTHQPLSVQLGPGLLGSILTHPNFFVISINILLIQNYGIIPNKDVYVGDALDKGSNFGHVVENDLVVHHLMLPETGIVEIVSIVGE